jgi:putative peptide zinc metalloprotease protein
LCFYVDSSDGITLPRRARIKNALAGLAVDLVTTAILLLVSHGFAATVLVMSVCWRLAILQLIGIVENGLPILEVDGQVALADYLDEPDLSPRSREALSCRLRGVHQHERPPWLAAYGAFSLIGGIVLLVMSTWVWWLAAGDMIKALFAGNPAEILLGLYVVVPVALAALFSAIGLALEFVSKPTAAEHDRADSLLDS